MERTAGNFFVSKLCRSNYVPHQELISAIVVAEALLMDRNKFENFYLAEKRTNHTFCSMTWMSFRREGCDQKAIIGNVVGNASGKIRTIALLPCLRRPKARSDVIAQEVAVLTF